MENYIDNDMKAKKEIRKAKRNIVSVFLFMFVIFLNLPLMIYAVYNGVFPKAKKLDYPEYSLIESITVSQSDELINLTDEESRLLYKYIRTSKPTRIMSANEKPDVLSYYTVEIKSKDVSFYGYGYIYQQNDNFYFEIPYVGVYRLRI